MFAVSIAQEMAEETFRPPPKRIRHEKDSERTKSGKKKWQRAENSVEESCGKEVATCQEQCREKTRLFLIESSNECSKEWMTSKLKRQNRQKK